MANLIHLISISTRSINEAWDAVKGSIAKQLGLEDPIRIVPYLGYGTPNTLYLKGRVVQDQEIKLREANASVWKNVRNMYRRFETDEIPKAQVRICFEGIQQDVITDNEGFYETEIHLEHNLSSDRLWQKVRLELLEPRPEDESIAITQNEIIIVSENAKFGVISDIDDTIMRTAATDMLKMIRLAYLGNEHTRKPFAGVPDFYRALQEGQTGSEGNPIFYVSSSAWNMYDLFIKFMECNDVPSGPILLRDVELSPENLLSFEHQTHKLEQIEPIFQRFPDLPFILIGDSGEKDAEIYSRIAHDNPGRILGIYIRDVTPDDPERHEELSLIAETVRQSGSQWMLFSDTLAAAKHAAEQGWIAENALATVG